MKVTMGSSVVMADLKGQYLRIKEEIDASINEVLTSTQFIKGPQVHEFENNLSTYLQGAQVIGCGNGTDALQIALMALDLKPRDEVIVPAFTYVSCAEVVALLNLVPVWVDVDPKTFNINAASVEKFISNKTRAIIAVHLFGQCAPMDDLLALSKKHNLFIVEDVAQALGAEYVFDDGRKQKAGTIGDIGCTSFFPSKILGCYGDGGALITKNPELAERIRMIANHGQKQKYIHHLIGVNSRLDTLQAAILNVKLKYINAYISARQDVAYLFNELLEDCDQVERPFNDHKSTHVYNVYTIKVDSKRDQLKAFLQSKGIPSMIYYPLPLNMQPAFININSSSASHNFPVSEQLCKSVLSLPIHTEMETAAVEFIAENIKLFFRQ